MSVADSASQRVQSLLAIAESIAAFLDHPSVECEHVLMALLSDRDGVAAIALDNLGINRKELRVLVEQSIAHLGIDAAATTAPEFSVRARAMLDQMPVEARRLDHNYQSTEHLLLALLNAEGTDAARLLREHGVTVDLATAEILTLLGPSAAS